ncbi:MAG: GAF domain-containing protein [Halodesulfurarchaeum sp.]
MPEKDFENTSTVEEYKWNQEAVLELTDVMSDPAYRTEEKLRTALEIVADRSDFPVVYLTHIDEGIQQLLLVENSVGLDGIEEGRTDPLSDTYCRYTVSGDSELTVLEVGRNLPRDDPAYRNFGFEYYVGAPVQVEGNVYGTVCLADTETRGSKLPGPVKALVRVLSMWLGYEIERMEQERHTAVLERVLRHNLRNSLIAYCMFGNSSRLGRHCG